MLKKIVVVCSLLMLLSTMAVAAPAKGKFVVTAPMISAQGIFALAVDNWSFGDDGNINIFGMGQNAVSIGSPIAVSAPWLIGYMLTDNLELGINISYSKSMGGGDSFVSLGAYGAYYLKMNKLMPFIKVGVARVDINEAFPFGPGAQTLINSSIGIAYALSQTVAPYLSLDFDTMVDEGTLVSLTFGLKFMF